MTDMAPPNRPEGHDAATERRVTVWFDAELALIGDEVPETLTPETMAQAIQDSIGYSGVKVVDVFDWQAENR